jgi:pyroglutamyl-peptidase
MIKLLITGFQPFGGETINPSFEAIKKLDPRVLPCELYSLELPVVYYESSKILIEKIKDLEPDIILMVGQAGGRKAISIERIAINLDDSLIPDAKGVSPMDDPISVFGPPAYFSTLPVKHLCQSLKDKHIPAELSYTAGTYICNHIFYSVMHELDVTKKTNVKAGFIHVPYETSQVHHKPHLFSLELEVIKEALEVIIIETIHSLTV